MSRDNKAPGSFEEAKQALFRRIWECVYELSFGLKLIVVLVALFMLFALARLKIFSEPYYRYARGVLPLHIPIVDDPIRVIPLSLTFDIENEGVRMPAKLGDPCYSGDHVHLSFEAGIVSWISVFSMDIKGVYGLLQYKLDPSQVEVNKSYTIDYTLDDTVGNEVFYAIAAERSFKFQEDIAPYLPRTSKLVGNKGPAESSYLPILPDKFTVKFVYCSHLPKPK